MKEIITIGKSSSLCAEVYPSNATNKNVTWHSNNSDVASVGLHSGIIYAKKLGTATITATTADGGYTASATVIVKLESVTISKGDIFNKVVFNSSGKTWHCVNHDTIYNENYTGNALLYELSNRNYYVDFPNNNVEVRTYSDEEIKLLYAIDPYGVADYVQRYADHLSSCYGDLSCALNYKDRIFELLFNRKPTYFARNLNEQWYVTSNKDNPLTVISESEAIFGKHQLFDIVSIFKIRSFIIDIAIMVLGLPAFDNGSDAAKIQRIAKYYFLSLSAEADVISGVFGNFIIDEGLGYVFEKTKLGWAWNMISIYKSMGEIVDTLTATPNFYKDILSYCAKDVNYDVYMELENGVKFKIDDICEALKNAE